MREKLKTLEEVLEPDRLNSYWVSLDLRTGAKRKLTLADYHERVSNIELVPSVPDEIANQFLVARHMALYSWFVLRFTMPAQLQSYATLEYALREHFGFPSSKRSPGLKNLLEMAIAGEALREERFRDWPGHPGFDGEISAGGVSGEWLRRLPDPLSRLRNSLAHGSTDLYSEHLRVLRMVADAINQLYDEAPTEG